MLGLPGSSPRRRRPSGSITICPLSTASSILPIFTSDLDRRGVRGLLDVGCGHHAKSAGPEGPLGSTRKPLGRRRRVRFRRIFLLAAHPGEGRFNESTAATQPWLRELVFMPHTRRLQYPSGPAQLDGRPTFPKAKEAAKSRRNPPFARAVSDIARVSPLLLPNRATTPAP